ncbi:MAG: hypothetical protein QM723_05820 [Myxococcaceae bacterium]
MSAVNGPTTLTGRSPFTGERLVTVTVSDWVKPTQPGSNCTGEGERLTSGAPT